MISSSPRYVSVAPLAQTQLLHRQADVTTGRWECQAFVRSRWMRVCPTRPPRPVEWRNFSRLCSRTLARLSLSADPDRATASCRRFQRLWMTVEMWISVVDAFPQRIQATRRAKREIPEDTTTWTRNSSRAEADAVGTKRLPQPAMTRG